MTPIRIFGYTAVSTEVQTDRISLTEQAEAIRDYATRIGGDIVHMAVVPGHTRNYRSLTDMQAAFKADGVTALDELLAAIKAKSFTRLAILDADRIARDQSPFAEFVNRVMDSGADIYCIADNTLISTPEQAAIFIAMRGFFAAAEVRRLRGKWVFGTKARAAAGLNPNNVPQMSHILIEDKASPYKVRLIVDESKRRLFDDMAASVMAGIGYGYIHLELAKLGHVNPNTGRVYQRGVIWQFLNNPLTWGHTGQGYSRHLGAWAWDESEPIPPGATIYRNMIPAVYTGDQAAGLIDEMRRRRELRGSSRPQQSRPFAGIFICGTCGNLMNTANNGKGQYYYACRAHFTNKTPACPNRRMFREEDAQAFLNGWLLDVLAGRDFPEALPFDRKLGNRADQLQAEIAELNRQIGNLIRAQAASAAPPQVTAIYAEQIGVLGSQLAILDREYQAARNAAAATADRDQHRMALVEDLRAVGVDHLWELSGVEINQRLKAILGSVRFAVQDGQVVSRVEHRVHRNGSKGASRSN